MKNFIIKIGKILFPTNYAMEEFSAGGVAAEVAGGITIGSILTYFGLTTEGLMILTVFLAVDIIFGLIESYVVTKDTSSNKLVKGLSKKFGRRALPFVAVAALKGIGYENVDAISNVIMSVLILSEAYSVIGHIYTINYGKKLKEIDALKLLLEMIAQLFRGELAKKNPDGDSKE